VFGKISLHKKKVAETTEFRGNYIYNPLDENIRFNAQVPQLVQWDDHEVTNNWYPGEILTDIGLDARYTVKDVDLLSDRARQAFLEYVPIRLSRKIQSGSIARFSTGSCWIFSCSISVAIGDRTQKIVRQRPVKRRYFW